MSDQTPRFEEPPPGLRGGGQSRAGSLKYVLITVGVVFGLLLLAGGACVYYFMQRFKTDPAEVEAVAKDILACELPQGLRGRLAVEMWGLRMAFLARGDELFLGLCSAPPGLEEAEAAESMEQVMETAAGKSGADVVSRNPVTFTVLGREVQGTEVVERTRDKTLVHAYVLSFPYGERTALVYMAGPGVDKEAVERFLSTVKPPPAE